MCTQVSDAYDFGQIQSPLAYKQVFGKDIKTAIFPGPQVLVVVSGPRMVLEVDIVPCARFQRTNSHREHNFSDGKRVIGWCFLLVLAKHRAYTLVACSGGGVTSVGIDIFWLLARHWPIDSTGPRVETRHRCRKQPVNLCSEI